MEGLESAPSRVTRYTLYMHLWPLLTSMYLTFD